MEGSSSPRVGISTALQASPARSTRSSREEHLSLSEGLLPIRTSPTQTAMQPAANRASLRAKWIVLRMCLVVFGIASCMVLVIDARQSRWVSKLMRGGTSGSQAPATPFEVTSCSLSPVHECSIDRQHFIRPRRMHLCKVLLSHQCKVHSF